MSDDSYLSNDEFQQQYARRLQSALEKIDQQIDRYRVPDDRHISLRLTVGELKALRTLGRNFGSDGGKP